MIPLGPLQLVDDFLIQYELGQALILLFILALPAGYVRGSRKITAINVTMFGLLFIIVPSIGAGSIDYGFLGIALLVLGPILYATAKR